MQNIEGAESDVKLLGKHYAQNLKLHHTELYENSKYIAVVRRGFPILFDLQVNIKNFNDICILFENGMFRINFITVSKTSNELPTKESFFYQYFT